jgi:Flp pilus assembly protein TadG
VRDPGSTTSRRCWRDEHGNTLLLMPVAVLVLLVLAALAFDAAAVFLQQRRLADLAASLANDSVARLDPASLYDEDRVPTVDAAAAADLAAARLAAFHRDGPLREVTCQPTTAGDEVTVACTGQVTPVFGRALGQRGAVEVRAVETARAAVR